MRTSELRVCVSPIHPSVAVAEPPGCRDDCTVRGPAYETVVAFAATLGADIEVNSRTVEWDEQFHDATGKTVREASYTPRLLESGECDLYPNQLARNAWRSEKLDFVTLFRSRMMVIVSKAQAAGFTGPDDLAGRVAAVEKDTSFHTWLQEQNANTYASAPVQIKLMPMMRAIESVDLGRVDFTIMDSDAAIWSTRHQFLNSAVAFPVGPVDDIGWAFRKADKRLQAAVRRFFESQKTMPNSAINRIWRRALGISLDRFEAIVKATQ